MGNFSAFNKNTWKVYAHMKSTQQTLFLVWQFDTVIDGYVIDDLTGSQALTHQQSTLRAADTTITQARKHKKFLEKAQAKKIIANIIEEKANLLTFFRIESCSANHLFGSKGGLGTLERINKRKQL